MHIDVNVPGLLKDCTGGRASFTIEAETLEDAIRVLLETYPLLRIHLFTETGETRKHVLLYYNDDNIAWLDSLDIPLKKGDRLIVLQSVSGG
ncbi:MoaD/ThiS family protein [Paenibacillus sp. MBLB4367]|uniref:MoaD/ThiS family protein n=1 Tax=Paenibacillus sp. MBLB4367 TaxID=3384767 RepID=UPI0039081804